MKYTTFLGIEEARKPHIRSSRNELALLGHALPSSVLGTEKARKPHIRLREKKLALLCSVSRRDGRPGLLGKFEQHLLLVPPRHRGVQRIRLATHDYIHIYFRLVLHQGNVQCCAEVLIILSIYFSMSQNRSPRVYTIY